MTDSFLKTSDKQEEAQSSSFLPFGILNGISLMFTFVSLGLTISAQAKGNLDHNIFLWSTSVCAISLCFLQVSFYTIGFVAICRKDYTVLLACPSLVVTCGILLYFLIGLSYVFCVVNTVFVMEDHAKTVNVCLLVNLGLEAARFFILFCSIHSLLWV